MDRRFPVVTVIVLVGALVACGEKVELAPELQAHLDAYENLIEDFEPQFARARGNHAEYAKVAETYSRQARDWIQQWQTLAPDLSTGEGKAIQAAVNRLNKRAEKMLLGN